jgi:hypothetical protein
MVRLWPQGPEGRVDALARRSGGTRISAQDSEEYAVAIAPVAPLRPAGDSLALEAGRLECSLFGDVVDVGVGLDSVSRRVGEEQVRKLTLSGAADTSPPMARPQPNPDHRASGPSVGSPVLPVPTDAAGHLTVVGDDAQRAGLVETGRARRRAGCGRSEFVEGALPTRQEGEVIGLLRTQSCWHRIILPSASC